MSLSLGEKLRQAREERGLSISEVAEQTRISSLYLQSIENDDYNLLPGGIFNKGFVKSFAKFVGINEQEALDDYSRLITQTESGAEEDLKVFRPEVLTDDRSATSMAPTVIIAAIILALMTVGVLFLVDYLKQPATDLTANTQITNNNTNAAVVEQAPSPEVPEIPDMNSIKIEFMALSEPVSLLVTNDGKLSSNTVNAGTSVLFEPKERLKLSYSRSLASIVQLTINGKKITLPAQPLVPRRNAIEFEINRENLGQIWESGAISAEAKGAEVLSNSNLTMDKTPITGVPQPTRPVSRATPGTPRLSNSDSNSAGPVPQPSRVTRTAPSPAPLTSPDR